MKDSIKDAKEIYSFFSGSVKIKGTPAQLIEFIQAIRGEVQPSTDVAEVISTMDMYLAYFGYIRANEGKTPAFSVGDRVIFKTTDTGRLQLFNGAEVQIKRPLSASECDIDDVGFMYEVAWGDERFHAFEDELSAIPSGYEEAVEEMMKEIKKQFDAGCTTVYNEPQAYIDLENGRSIEVTLEQEGMPEEEHFYSARLHCNEEEFDNDDFHASCGVIDCYMSHASTEDQIPNLLKAVLRSNDNCPVAAHSSKKEGDA